MDIEHLGLQIEIHWFDIHAIELHVRCANGRFFGPAYCYAGHDALRECAGSLRGFPTTREDRREFTFGTLDPQFAGGGVHLCLRCVDGPGHAVATVQIRSETDKPMSETAEFSFSVEPAAIDLFVGQLDQAKLVNGPVALLRRAT